MCDLHALVAILLQQLHRVHRILNTYLDRGERRDAIEVVRVAAHAPMPTLVGLLGVTLALPTV
jgi:hypothetical protein